MARKKNKFTEEVEDINLVPVMNLVLCLIPAVLFNTQLVKIGMIDVNAPKFAPPSSTPPPPDAEKPLGLTLLLDNNGFLLSAKGKDLSTADMLGEGDSKGVRINLVSNADYKDDGAIKRGKSGLPNGKTYDYVSLYSKLKKIRDKNPDKKDKPPEVLTISADNNVEFKYIIRTMDVARFELKKEVKKPEDFNVLEEKNSYIKEKSKNAKGETVESNKTLWAYVTFATPSPEKAK